MPERSLSTDREPAEVYREDQDEDQSQPKGWHRDPDKCTNHCSIVKLGIGPSARPAPDRVATRSLLRAGLRVGKCSVCIWTIASSPSTLASGRACTSWARADGSGWCTWRPMQRRRCSTGWPSGGSERVHVCSPIAGAGPHHHGHPAEGGCLRAPGGSATVLSSVTSYLHPPVDRGQGAGHHGAAPVRAPEPAQYPALSSRMPRRWRTGLTAYCASSRSRKSD